MPWRKKQGASVDKLEALEARVRDLEDAWDEVIGILKTAGGKLRDLPPEATPLDAHKIIIRAGGDLANIKRGKRKK